MIASGMAYGEDEFEDETDLHEREDPDESDADESNVSDDDSETLPCPYCRKPVYEEADVCPHCRNFVSFADVPSRRPWWLVAGVAVGVVIVLIWVVRYV
jgi:hypothetical protein